MLVRNTSKMRPTRGVWSAEHNRWERPPGLNDPRAQCPLDVCPFCGTVCEADWCDVGVGYVQSGPYRCVECLAVQRGPYDKDERPTFRGWFLPGEPAGSSANTVAGRPVGHKVAERLYRMRLLDDK